MYVSGGQIVGEVGVVLRAVRERAPSVGGLQCGGAAAAGCRREF
jgi:hypothetical protein